MHFDTSSLLLHFLLHFFYTSLTEEIQAAPLSTAQEVHHAASVIIRACSGVMTVCVLIAVMRTTMVTVVSVILHFSYTSPTLIHSPYTSTLLLHFYTSPTIIHWCDDGLCADSCDGEDDDGDCGKCTLLHYTLHSSSHLCDNKKCVYFYIASVVHTYTSYIPTLL